jgi:hypothetical protein
LGVHICLYQNFKVTPFVGNKSDDDPREWSLKSTLFSLFLRKFIHTLKPKKYPFSVKISYKHVAPLGRVKTQECYPFLLFALSPGLQAAQFTIHSFGTSSGVLQKVPLHFSMNGLEVTNPILGFIGSQLKQDHIWY